MRTRGEPSGSKAQHAQHEVTPNMHEERPDRALLVVEHRAPRFCCGPLIEQGFLVGDAGFEPATSSV